MGVKRSVLFWFALLVLTPVVFFVSCQRVDMPNSSIDIEAKGPDGLPGIFWLIKERDQSAVGAWLDAGGDIESKGYHGATPVLAAAIIDDWPMVLYLIHRGARLDVADKRGFTLGYRSTTTRVDLEGIFGPALLEVREVLAEADLLDEIYPPQVVREMKAAGEWPPEHSE